MNKFENFIFSNIFRDGVQQAVQDAVAEATVRDLPKTYEPDFSQVQSAIALAREQNNSGGD